MFSYSDIAYGPFVEEELFTFCDTTVLELELLQIHDTERGFVGFNDLEKTHNLGTAGSFDSVMFSGMITLKKTSYLSEAGFKRLLKEATKKDATMGPEKFRKACKQGKITVEVHCQLAIMPVCYLTKTPPDSILIYSKNQNNVNHQRRYIVKTFDVACFRRSELTLRRYMVLKFILDACGKYRHEVPREDRDVHWLVKVYLEDYSTVFKMHERPRLHRSEVYDHFATHAEWLKKVFARKYLVDRGKWAEWIDEAKKWKKRAKTDGLKWGVPMARPVVRRKLGRNRRVRSFSLDSSPNIHREAGDYDIGTHFGIPSSESESNLPHSGSDEETSSESDNSEDDVQYAHNPRLRSRVHRGLLLPMPSPTWYWPCNITDDCRFVIDIGHQRTRDAPCMAPLNDKEKAYLVGPGSLWGLYDLKLKRIWKKMCQAHMDWHWKEAGLILDHERKMIYGVENQPVNAED